MLELIVIYEAPGRDRDLFLIGAIPSERELRPRPHFGPQLTSKAILRSEQMIEHPSRPLIVIP